MGISPAEATAFPGRFGGFNSPPIVLLIVPTVVSDQVGPDACDEIIHEPTMVVKLDATVNMYHHFCDFVNLYASLHFNRTAFSDVNIIVWDGVRNREPATGSEIPCFVAQSFRTR